MLLGRIFRALTYLDMLNLLQETEWAEKIEPKRPADQQTVVSYSEVLDKRARRKGELLIAHH